MSNVPNSYASIYDKIHMSVLLGFLHKECKMKPSTFESHNNNSCFLVVSVIFSFLYLFIPKSQSVRTFFKFIICGFVENRLWAVQPNVVELIRLLFPCLLPSGFLFEGNSNITLVAKRRQVLQILS